VHHACGSVCLAHRMLKIFLLTKNEYTYIEDWIRYHGYLFGLENIFILDGSTEKAVLDVYRKYRPFGLNVYHSTAGLSEVTRELNDLMHQHKGSDSFLIKLDTDEFLAYTKPFLYRAHNPVTTYITRRYLDNKKSHSWLKQALVNKSMQIRFSQKKIFLDNLDQQFELLPLTGQKYKASFTIWSAPGPCAVPNPCRSVTRFSPPQFTDLKSFFHSSSFVSVDLGCHKGVTTNNAGVINTGLTIIHYHNTSIEDTVRRAKQALASHDYIALDDDIPTQQIKLNSLRSRGTLPSFHKIDMYLKHLESLTSGTNLKPEILNSYHPYFRDTGAPRHTNIVQKTLSYIDESGFFTKAESEQSPRVKRSN